MQNLLRATVLKANTIPNSLSLIFLGKPTDAPTLPKFEAATKVRSLSNSRRDQKMT